MVSCKVAPHIRRLGASLAHHARGFCHHTVDAGESLSLRLLSMVEENVNASGKQLVSALRLRLQEEEQARLLLLQRLERIDDEGKQRLAQERRLRNEKERVWELLVAEKERVVVEKERAVQAEQQMRARDKIDLLRARGLNDTRGLFEMLQERLAQVWNITPGKKGTALWEDILASDQNLAACIERCTKVGAANKSKQAGQCYTVYVVLSQYVHAGKQLAHLQAQKGGIEFERGPLSPEMVEVLVCLGLAAGVKAVPLE